MRCLLPSPIFLGCSFKSFMYLSKYLTNSRERWNLAPAVQLLGCKKASFVVSIEANRDWFNKVSEQFHSLKIHSVAYRSWTKVDLYNMGGLLDESLDLIIVDESLRSKRVQHRHAKLRNVAKLYLGNSDKDMKNLNGDTRRERSQPTPGISFPRTYVEYVGYAPLLSPRRHSAKETMRQCHGVFAAGGAEAVTHARVVAYDEKYEP